MIEEHDFDWVVVGAGPAGIQAAIEAAEAGCDVLLIEEQRGAGGECVHRGTIPSKTLRETAFYLSGLRKRSAGVVEIASPEDMTIASLMGRLKAVRTSNEDFLGDRIERSGVTLWNGRAAFLEPNRLEVQLRSGSKLRVRFGKLVLATGSRPRQPEHIAIDHDHVLDSDSILSMIYLPRSLTVIGAGVIACEFASIFAALGVKVTIVDRQPRPMGFLDPELVDGFVQAFEKAGGSFLGECGVERVAWDGLSAVVTELDDGQELRAEKVLCAQGRMANVRALKLERVGIELTKRGHVVVDAEGRTTQPDVYAAGDVIGPPALAATAMVQGRRAVRHGLGLDPDDSEHVVPIGIYTIPEIASVGLTEEAAREKHGEVMVGRVRFDELSRAHINGDTDGVLKLVCDPAGRRLLGAHIVAEGATELIHVAQMALAGGLDVDALVENVFNFPTLAEAYRLAALEVVGQRSLTALRRVG